MTPFQWENCIADVYAGKHSITIEAYLRDVILPALEVLNRRIDELGRSDEPFAPFVKADTEAVLQETQMAFALSVQSIWERQLRAYLIGCARDLRPGEGIEDNVKKSDWKKLKKLFYRLRGIKFESFPSFQLLDKLHHLGNACRHGDGKSAIELSQRFPDLWRTVPSLPPGFGMLSSGPPAVNTMDVTIKHMREFVHAVSEFWKDTTYIYHESIEPKDPSLEARLVRERVDRSWLPQIPIRSN